jgi:hypothetical protein
MNLMLMPLPKKLEFLVRDVLFDRLQSQTMAEIVNEIYNNMTKINKYDSLSKKRFKNSLINLHSKEELKDIIRSFLNKMKAFELSKHTEVDITGDIACGGVCVAILIGLGCSVAGGVVANLLQDEWNDDEEEEEDEECDPDDFCTEIIHFQSGGYWDPDRYCYDICLDENGDSIAEKEVDCETGGSI